MKAILILILMYSSLSCKGQQNIGGAWLEFQNPTSGYKFSYPPNWKISGTPAEYLLAARNENSGQVEAEILFNAFAGKKESYVTEIDNSKKTHLKNLSSRPNFKLLEPRSPIITQSGFGFRVDFSSTKTQKDVEQIHTIICQIYKGKNVFRIMYRASLGVDVKYLSVLEDIFDSFSFLDEPPRFNRSVLKGRWDGTITQGPPGLSKPNPVPISIIFKNYTDSGTMETIQLVKNINDNRTDTLYNELYAVANTDILQLIYNMVLPNKSECIMHLGLFYNLKDGIHYLDGGNKYDSIACYHVSLSLKKVSDETDLSTKQTISIVPTTNTTMKPSGSNRTAQTTQNYKEEEILPAASQLFKRVRKLVSPKDTTEGDAIELSLSNKEKNEIVKSSGLSLNKNDTLFTDGNNDEPFEAYVNAFDFNDDGIYEIVVWKNDGAGPKMTNEFSIYYRPPTVDVGGRKYMPSYHSVLRHYGTPIVTKKKVFGFYTIVIGDLGGDMGPSYKWDQAFYSFGGNVPISDDVVLPYLKNLVGGATPEELGKNLLKALKTNDFQLWQHCLHPTDTEYRGLNEFRFNQCRDKLERAGISNWNLLEFSRVTYQKGDPPENSDGETIKRYFTIEYTYKGKEFLGSLGWMTIVTYKREKYFLYKQWEGAGLMRYKK